MNVILGQGIAGTVLAMRLLEAGEQVKIIDNNHKSSSSMVAAGLWNPIVFRRINKGWLADEMLAELEVFYQRMEILFGAKFYHEKILFRLHGSMEEKNIWYEKKDEPGYKAYLANYETDLQYINPEKLIFGHGFVKRGGNLDVPEFLRAARDYFLGNNILLTREISELERLEELKIEGKNIERIIDCRGSKSAESSYWSYLPFGLTKGEVLTIRCKGLYRDDVLNAGFFALPLGDDLYRLGATFNWKDKDAIPTEEGKAELINKFKKAVSLPFEVVDHRAGIRPTVQDRRPLLGRHPEFSRLYIFNGLGTKGVMLAPLLSLFFMNFLTDEVDLPNEMNISRFPYKPNGQPISINYPTP